MRSRILIVSWLGLSCAFLLTPIASAQTSHASTSHQTASQFYYFCVTENKPNAPTYITPIVLEDIGAHGEYIVSIEQDLKKSFAAFLAKQYGYTGTISCTNQDSRSWVENYRKGRIDLLRSRGYEVVETDWRPPQATSTPLPPPNQASAQPPVALAAPAQLAAPVQTAVANSAAAPQNSMVALCWSPMTATGTYYNDPFSTASGNNGAWAQAYSNYLKQKYGYKGVLVYCQAMSSMAVAQSQMRTLIGGKRATTVPDGSLGTYVETDWVYTPPAGTPAPVTYPPGTILSYCLTGLTAQHVIYYSRLASKSPTVTLDNLSASFSAYLLAKYGLKITTSCSQSATDSGTSNQRDFVIGHQAQIDGYHSSGYNIVETDWTYAPAAGATPAPAAVGQPNPCDSAVDHDLTKRPPGCVAPIHVSYVVCSASNATSTAYISATFQVTASDNAGWTNDFAQLLAQKYSYKGPIAGCANIDETSAQTYAKNRVVALRSGGKTVVETGWAFGSSPVLPVVIPAAAVPPALAPAAPVVPSTLYANCFGSTSGANPSAYFGVPFVTTARDTAAWTKDFRAFLVSRYGSQASAVISCNVWPTQVVAEQNAQQWRGRYSPTHKIIDTGWSYGSSASETDVTPSPAAAASQNTSFAVCWAESPARRTAYFGVPFPATKVNNQAWAKEYRDFLTTKYGQVGLISCRTLQSLPEAQQQAQTWKDSARSRDQLVETGWKYQ